MNSSNIVTPHNNTCSRVLLQQLRLCPAFLGEQEFREGKLCWQKERGEAPGCELKPPWVLGSWWETRGQGGLRAGAAPLPGLGGLGGGMAINWGKKYIFPLFAAIYCYVFTASCGAQKREPGRAGPQRCCLLWEQKWHSQGENVAVKGDALGSWLCPGRVFPLITAPN